MFAGVGVRIGEAIAMRVGSVEAVDRSPRLRVLGKGNNTRVIPVGPEVVATIDDYLHSRRERAGCHSPTDALFVRQLKGEYVPFNRQAMDGLVARWYRRAGVIPPPGWLAQALILRSFSARPKTTTPSRLISTHSGRSPPRPPRSWRGAARPRHPRRVRSRPQRRALRGLLIAGGALEADHDWLACLERQLDHASFAIAEPSDRKVARGWLHWQALPRLCRRVGAGRSTTHCATNLRGQFRQVVAFLGHLHKAPNVGRHRRLVRPARRPAPPDPAIPHLDGQTTQSPRGRPPDAAMGALNQRD